MFQTKWRGWSWNVNIASIETFSKKELVANDEMKEGNEAVSAELHVCRTYMPQKLAIMLTLCLNSFAMLLFSNDADRHNLCKLTYDAEDAVGIMPLE